MSPPIVVTGLWKRFRLRHRSIRDLAYDLWPRNRAESRELRRSFWALRDVSFDVQAGETFGIVGANGSGKSTILKLMAGIMHPTRGRMQVTGRVALLSHLGAGFHSELSGVENVFLQGAIYGIDKHDLTTRLEAIISFAECEQFRDVPVKFYSSGMRLRLAFSIATHIEPDVLLIDEALAVGDTAFRDKCLDRILSFHRAGTTMIVVSHERYLIEQLCDRSILLEGGSLMREGSSADVFVTYEQAIQTRQREQGVVAEVGESPNSPLRIDAVEIVGAEPGVEAVIRTDDSLRIRIQLTAIRDVQSAVVGVQVAKEWHILHGTRSNRQGVTIDAVANESITVEIEYERVSLSGGSYLIHVLILEHPLAREAVLRFKQAAKFRIVQSEREGVGLVRIPHQWRIVH